MTPSSMTTAAGSPRSPPFEMRVSSRSRKIAAVIVRQRYPRSDAKAFSLIGSHVQNVQSGFRSRPMTTTITPSSRGFNAPTSPIRALEAASRAAVDAGKTVHFMNIGQPDIATPRGMIDAYRSYDEKVLSYSPSDGYPAYREALASNYYDKVVGSLPPITAEDIVVTVGGSEALLFAIAAVTDPGDDILVCEPYYTNYAGYTHLLGVTASPVTTHVRDGYQIDPAMIESAITEKTRALVLPTPGNPTGVVLSLGDLEKITEICLRHGIFFICDEVYREFVYDQPAGTLAPSMLAVAGAEDIAIVIDSVSKRYSACGARVGCLVTRNKDVRRAALHFAQARLSPATVDQLAGLAALSTPPEYFTDVIETYRERRDVLVAGLESIGISVPAPQGAFYIAVPLPVDDAADFCSWLVSEFDLDGETLCMAPLGGFYSTEGLGRNEVRMAYVLDKQVISRCVEILEAGLAAYAEKE
ncbi:MAG TPA: aspartate aminotransferase [Phycisphaerales bacterium]|nr:aspartate aminotransferase [Phycisphaerales bacterium]